MDLCALPVPPERCRKKAAREALRFVLEDGRCSMVQEIQTVMPSWKTFKKILVASAYVSDDSLVLRKVMFMIRKARISFTEWQL